MIMPSIQEVKQRILNGDFDPALRRVYITQAATEQQRPRYARVLDSFLELYGEREDLHFYSAPGRTEIGGNHTDHNHGKVLAASINLDAVAAAAPNTDAIARVKSEGYQMDVVNLNELGVVPSERGHSVALLRGMLAGFKNRDYQIGGFDAATVSDVLAGSGLSSSAAFEVLLGTVLNQLFNGGKVSAVELAQIAQQAENEYFGKPCGLLDQTTSAVGSCVTIDFRNPKAPVIEQVTFDLSAYGYSLCIVDTGGNHADLTHEYAAIPQEMKAVAAKLGAAVLRDADRSRFEETLPLLREALGDRAVLRAIHFFAENDRVDREVAAIREGRFRDFLEEVIESGHSSYMYNQNIYASALPNEQPVSIGLAVSEALLRGRGAWRVHGGGFAGTMQAFVPDDLLEIYRKRMESIFGQRACYVLSIRPLGGVLVL